MELLALRLKALAASSVLNALLAGHGKTLFGMTPATAASDTLCLELRRSEPPP